MGTGTDATTADLDYGALGVAKDFSMWGTVGLGGTAFLFELADIKNNWHKKDSPRRKIGVLFSIVMLLGVCTIVFGHLGTFSKWGCPAVTGPILQSVGASSIIVVTLFVCFAHLTMFKGKTQWRWWNDKHIGNDIYKDVLPITGDAAEQDLLSKNSMEEPSEPKVEWTDRPDLSNLQEDYGIVRPSISAAFLELGDDIRRDSQQTEKSVP